MMPDRNRLARNKAEILKLNRRIVSCKLCPRLVAWREQVAAEKVARFSGWNYWGKPVPGLGDPQAQLLIVGLAPAAHGANRTGRMFTGDRSGDWLYRALHKFGFANQASSESSEDGLRLKNCFITAAARCAPPANKPLPEEMRNCRPYLIKEFHLLEAMKVILGLGKIACDVVFDVVRELKLTTLTHRPKFMHGMELQFNDQLLLIGSYHPSQQNTFTGKLTEKMFDDVFRRVKEHLTSMP